MQLSQFLKVPIIYFFEDFKEFKDVNLSDNINEDLNYSFKQNFLIFIENPKR